MPPERAPVSVPELQRLQQCDPAAWNHAFDLLWPEALHVARRRLARMSPEDAEDVAVEAMGDAAGMVGRLAGFEELRALVRVLAHRRAVDLVRSREALMRREPSGERTSARPDAEAADRRPEPWEQADALDVARWLSEAVQRLRPLERALLAGHYVEGRTHAELASLHGVSRATLGVRLARILVKLRRRLDRYVARPWKRMHRSHGGHGLLNTVQPAKARKLQNLQNHHQHATSPCSFCGG